MSDVYEWGNETICAPDTTDLYNTEPTRIYELGFPVQLDQAPPTFCSVCLFWFTGDHDEGSEHRPPETKEPDE